MPTAVNERAAPRKKISTSFSIDHFASVQPTFYTYPAVEAQERTSAISKRTKRTQVKIACSNCQKACKRCSQARPCDRCLKYGIEAKCVDSERKERKKVVPKRGKYKKRDGNYTSIKQNEGGVQIAQMRIQDVPEPDTHFEHSPSNSTSTCHTTDGSQVHAFYNGEQHSHPRMSASGHAISSSQHANMHNPKICAPTSVITYPNPDIQSDSDYTTSPVLTTGSFNSPVSPTYYNHSPFHSDLPFQYAPNYFVPSNSAMSQTAPHCPSSSAYVGNAHGQSFVEHHPPHLASDYYPYNNFVSQRGVNTGRSC